MSNFSFKVQSEKRFDHKTGAQLKDVYTVWIMEGADPLAIMSLRYVYGKGPESLEDAKARARRIVDALNNQTMPERADMESA